MAFSSGNKNGPMAEINVTPLVDVMLVLLIIFIITTPLLNHKVHVDLPKANLNKKDQEDKRPNPISLAVKEDGSLFWNDEPITREVLTSRLASAALQKPQPSLNVRADRTTKMHTIDEITKIAQDQGLLDIGFIATKDKGQ